MSQTLAYKCNCITIHNITNLNYFTIMATNINTTATKTTNNIEREKQIIEKRNIIRVTRGKNDEKNRYYIEVDGEPFKGFNKNNEEVLTNSFSMNLTTLVGQIGIKSEMLSTAFAMASVQGMKKALNPEIVALCLVGATISVRRDLKLATDLREGGEEGATYGSNVWKNTIIAFESHLTAFATQIVASRIMNPDTLTIMDVNENAIPSASALFANIAG